MKTLNDLLDRAKVCRNFESDAQLAAALGVSRQAVHAWRHGRAAPTNAHIATMARYCREDVGTWLALLTAA